MSTSLPMGPVLIAGYDHCQPTGLSAFNGDRFILGALSVPFRLVEGDGTRIITRANVQVEVDPTKVKLPSEMAVWRKELEQQLRTSPDPPVFMFASLGICVTAVTADQFLIVTRRSGKLGTGRDEWNVSANEGLSRDLDASGRHPPDLHKVAERGLVEELALAYGEYDLSMLGIGLECKRYQWARAFALADCT